MSLVTNLQNAFTRIGTEFKAIRSEIAASSTADRARANHTGTQSADTLTDGATNRLYTSAEKTKLGGVASGATANQTDAFLLARGNHTGTQLASTVSNFDTQVRTSRLDQMAAPTAAVAMGSQKITGLANGAAASQDAATVSQMEAGNTAAKARANHTGTQSADTITDGTTNKAFLATERTKLASVATGATANQTDAYLLSRANHTGTQPSSTISDFNTASDARVDAKVGTLSSLTTTAKSNVVAAINELDAAVDAVAAGSGAISDGTTSASTTWSSNKINTTILSSISTVVSGAPAALDTLDELAAALGDDANYAATVTTALGNRVRVDAAQVFTAPQQLQARQNIDAASLTDVGDTTTNFVTTFEAALV